MKPKRCGKIGVWHKRSVIKPCKVCGKPLGSIYILEGLDCHVKDCTPKRTQDGDGFMAPGRGHFKYGRVSMLKSLV